MSSDSFIIDKLIELVFMRYQICKIHIAIDVEDASNRRKLNLMKNFVFVIDRLLDLFNETDKKFIIDVYINKKTWIEMHCSESTFYYKKRKCNDTLYRYIEEYNKEWI